MNILGPLLLLTLSGHVKAWWGGQTQQQSQGHASSGSFASSQSHSSSHSSASASGYGAATNPPGYHGSAQSSGFGSQHASSSFGSQHSSGFNSQQSSGYGAAVQHGGNYSPPSYGGYNKPKPVNCAVAAWGPWSHSDANGVSSRYRKIQQHPSNGGHPCPSLVETRVGKWIFIMTIKFYAGKCIILHFYVDFHNKNMSEPIWTLLHFTNKNAWNRKQ